MSNDQVVGDTDILWAHLTKTREVYTNENVEISVAVIPVTRGTSSQVRLRPVGPVTEQGAEEGVESTQHRIAHLGPHDLGLHVEDARVQRRLAGLEHPPGRTPAFERRLHPQDAGLYHTLMAPPRIPIEERFWAKVEITDGCWLWTARLTSSGYGQISEPLGGGRVRMHMAHKWLFEQSVGPVPRGMTLDHLCHNADPTCNAGSACQHRRCVRPDHLAIKSSRDNTFAGRTPAAINAAKDVCWRGHSLSGDNLYITKNKGGRQCRACVNIRKAEARIRKRATH